MSYLEQDAEQKMLQKQQEAMQLVNFAYSVRSLGEDEWVYTTLVMRYPSNFLAQDLVEMRIQHLEEVREARAEGAIPVRFEAPPTSALAQMAPLPPQDQRNEQREATPA